MAKVKEEQSSQQTKQVLAFSTRLRHDLKNCLLYTSDAADEL